MKALKTTLHIGLSIPEDRNVHLAPITMRDTAITIAHRYLAGFNVVEVVGFWEGEKEQSIQLSWLSTNTGDSAELRGDNLAEDIRRALHQDAVLIERAEVSMVFSESTK